MLYESGTIENIVTLFHFHYLSRKKKLSPSSVRPKKHIGECIVSCEMLSNAPTPDVISINCTVQSVEYLPFDDQGSSICRWDEKNHFVKTITRGSKRWEHSQYLVATSALFKFDVLSSRLATRRAGCSPRPVLITGRGLSPKAMALFIRDGWNLLAFLEMLRLHFGCNPFAAWHHRYSKFLRTAWDRASGPKCVRKPFSRSLDVESKRVKLRGWFAKSAVIWRRENFFLLFVSEFFMTVIRWDFEEARQRIHTFRWPNLFHNRLTSRCTASCRSNFLHMILINIHFRRHRSIFTSRAHPLAINYFNGSIRLLWW